MMSKDEDLKLPTLSIEDETMDADDLIRNSQNFLFLPPSQTVSMSSIDTESTDMEEPEGRLDVRVKPSAVLRSNSIQGSQMKAYEMNRLPRGYALIIDIEVYENDIHERRLGSHVDVENLKSLLEQLSFDVRVFKDLSQANFYKELSEFANWKLHAEANMAVVGILSHGKDGIVYAADGQSIDMEYIYEYFNNKNCPALQGKPKFFIVQACRGDRNDQGVDSSEIPEAVKDSKRKRKAMSDKVQDSTDRGTCSRARPTWEDMIIAYSTIPGYASLRDHYTGTWFIQSLVQVFQEHCHNTELIDLLRMTSAKLSEFENEQGEKQTCNIEMRHLYKRIYFNPGLGPASNSSMLPGSSFPSRPSASFGAGGQQDLAGPFHVPPVPAPLTRSKSTPPTNRKNQQDSKQWFLGNKKENTSIHHTLTNNHNGLLIPSNSNKTQNATQEKNLPKTVHSSRTSLLPSKIFLAPDANFVTENRDLKRSLGSKVVRRFTSKVTGLKFSRLKRQNGFRERFRKHKK